MTVRREKEEGVGSTSIALGINTCFAVKRWPQPEQWMGIVAEELGLERVQLSADLLPAAADAGPLFRYADDAAAAASQADVRIEDLFTGLAAYSSNLLLSDDPYARDAAEAWYRLLIDLAARLGARGAGGHIGAYSIPSSRQRERREALATELVGRMLRLGEYAAVSGLDYLLFENLAVAREPGHTIEEALRLEDALEDSAVPWRLCLDVGHPAALTTGSSSDYPAAWLDQSWKRLPVLQLQQSPRGADLHGAFTAANNVDGLVRREDILPRIVGWDAAEVVLHLEVIPAHEADDDQVIRDLAETVAYWRHGIEETNGE